MDNTRDPWLQDVELDSWEEHESRSSEGTDFEDDDLEYGTYQFAIVDRSPLFVDKFDTRDIPDYEKKKKVNLKFVVVNSDDPADLGKRISQWFTVSSHPMSELYPVFKAAAGGHLDVNVRPRLTDLNQAQVKATWAPKIYNMPGQGVIEKDKLQTFMPARSTYPVPAYR